MNDEGLRLNVKMDHVLPERVLPREQVRLCFGEPRLAENWGDNFVEAFVERVKASGCSAAEAHFEKTNA
jgi:hypothetical protein